MKGLLTPEEQQSLLHHDNGQDEKRYYSFIWEGIQNITDHAIILRGPRYLGPVESNSNDLHIRVSQDLTRVATFLQEHGFCREYSPEPYMQIYRLRLVDHCEPYTVTLYKSRHWGLGFLLRGGGGGLPDRRLACLLHAVVDGRGTSYFEKELNGPPWRQGNGFSTSCANPFARMLWHSGSTGLLTAYLVLVGVIRPDFPVISRNLLRRAVFRFWLVTRKRGLEVGLIGVDGTGKSSLAEAFRRLPAPVKVIYIGYRDYRTWLMKLNERRQLPTPIPHLALRYDLLVRRLYGWLLSRRGYIVVYDRHPAERRQPHAASLRDRVKNTLDGLYAWPVDVTFWLTGHYGQLYERKREQSMAILQNMDEHIREVLQYYSIPFEQINVTTMDLNSVIRVTGNQILSRYSQRLSLDNLPGILSAIIV